MNKLIAEMFFYKCYENFMFFIRNMSIIGSVIKYDLIICVCTKANRVSQLIKRLVLFFSIVISEFQRSIDIFKTFSFYYSKNSEGTSFDRRRPWTDSYKNKSDTGQFPILTASIYSKIILVGVYSRACHNCLSGS